MPCFRGEIRGKQKKFSSISPEEEKGAEEAFDRPLNEVAIVENAGQYEVVRTVFGKEKVRKVK